MTHLNLVPKNVLGHRTARVVLNTTSIKSTCVQSPAKPHRPPCVVISFKPEPLNIDIAKQLRANRNLFPLEMCESLTPSRFGRILRGETFVLPPPSLSQHLKVTTVS